MTKIRLNNLSKSFERTRACWDMNLTIKDGEFFTLLGPSGCGKTTTLRLIAGLEKPTKGEIYFDGENATNQKPTERNVAMVFQSYALYPHMSVYDNIAFPLRVGDKSFSNEKIDSKVRETADFVNITDQLEKRPNQLSGGQQQRVALARAIVREPRVFLMDEPLSNLDAKLRGQMRTELMNLHEKIGITTIYVTHDQMEAMSMADRIALMKDGVVQQKGSPQKLFNEPKNTWCARFIGTPPMNFLECYLKEREGVYYLSGQGFEYRIDKDIADIIIKAGTQDHVEFGVRPRDLQIAEGGEHSISGKVFAIEPTGERVIINVEVGGVKIKAEIDSPTFDSEKGEEVFLEPSRRAYIYDGDGELLTHF